jgi:hypothetical protein
MAGANRVGLCGSSSKLEDDCLGNMRGIETRELQMAIVISWLQLVIVDIPSYWLFKVKKNISWDITDNIKM